MVCIGRGLLVIPPPFLAFAWLRARCRPPFYGGVHKSTSDIREVESVFVVELPNSVKRNDNTVRFNTARKATRASARIAA